MRKLLVYILFIFSSITYAQEINKQVFKNAKPEYIAGENIILTLKDNNSKSKLVIKSSLGTTVLLPKDNSFVLPKHICNNRGLIYWILKTETKNFKGSFIINPITTPKILETYLGPPSIIAGGDDFTMKVVIPTDSLDNPLPDSTKVILKKQFKENISFEDIYTKDLLAYKNIYSPLKSGKLILSTESEGLNSNEYDAVIRPHNPINFTISFSRDHDFADGNQITTFQTDVIKDQYNNIISDGSYVNFFITNKNGNTLKTSGSTINGIATGKIIHPEEPDTWTVKAFIEGLAESNSIQFSFLPAVDDFNVTFEKGNRFITVGPLQSFLNQNIPDGLKVSLILTKDGKFIKRIVKPSRKGYVKFIIDKNLYKDGIYDIEIKSAGIIKKFDNKKIWLIPTK